jgi:translation elongation factor EF-Ts
MQDRENDRYRMQKYMSEVTLLNQAFPDQPGLTGAAAAEAGATITGFVRVSKWAKALKL